jgi:predicted GNAT family acetyltransferase
VWHALNSGWSSLAIRRPKAWRLDPDYGPFAAAIDATPESATALADLIPAGGEIWLVELPDTPVPDFALPTVSAPIHQMVATHLAAVEHDFDIVSLSDDDAPEMRALAQLTKPGPFYAMTHRFGGFVGIRDKGRLVAMAGERMKLDGFAEVSGVCTHPDFRGQGYAAALISTVCTAMKTRGETPFLQSYADNAGANALYVSLGFRIRSPIILTRVISPIDPADCP